MKIAVVGGITVDTKALSEHEIEKLTRKFVQVRVPVLHYECPSLVIISCLP